jgi:hypothetical protein
MQFRVGLLLSLTNARRRSWGNHRAMQFRVGLLLALGACGFQSPGGDVSPPFCDPTDPQLIACYQFEGDTTDSSANHLHATMTNVSFPPVKLGKAMQFAADSAADVPDSKAFDVTALTIEAWIWPSQLPSNGNRAGILDMNGQYGFFIHAGGDLACSGGGAEATAAAQLATDRWTHVACTHDGTAATIYVDGVALSNATGAALRTGGTTGISLAADNPPGAGSRLIGLIDDVRMMNVARTAEQICDDAKNPTCP